MPLISSLTWLGKLPLNQVKYNLTYLAFATRILKSHQTASEVLQVQQMQTGLLGFNPK